MSEAVAQAEKGELARRISYWREFSGLRQVDLARACDVSESAVSRWESGGTKNVKQRNLRAIAAACGVSLQVFWGPIPETRD